MFQFMFKIKVDVLLMMFLCLPSFTAAETKMDGKEKDELTKKISQQDDDARGRITDARGEPDLAKLMAALSITVAQQSETMAQQSETVAQLEMKDMNRDEELRRIEMQMRKTKKELEKTKKELDNKIKKMETQMENKDKVIRQLDQKLAGPVEPLAKFLIQAGAEIKDNTKKLEKEGSEIKDITKRIVKLEKEGSEIKAITKRIVKLEKEGVEIKNNTKKIAECEKGFCGTCQRPYGAKMIPLKPYLGSRYAIYTEALDWITARAACANHGGQLASMETGDEWKFVYGQLKSKHGHIDHWIGAQKVGGGGPHEGFQWLTGGDISKDNSAWSNGGGGKCLLALRPNQFKIDNDWYNHGCHYTVQSLCEFK